MYHETNGNKPKSQENEEIEVTVRNLPNQVKTEDILEYLSIAGPIKKYQFTKEEERYSVVITYQDYESAYLCKKHLGDEYYKGRILTITHEVKKNYPTGGAPIPPTLSGEEEMAKQIGSYSPEQRKELLGYLKNLRGPGEIFPNFLRTKPKIVAALLGKYNQ